MLLFVIVCVQNNAFCCCVVFAADFSVSSSLFKHNIYKCTPWQCCRMYSLELPVILYSLYIFKSTTTLQLWDRRCRWNSSVASCVWYSDRAYYWVCVLIKGICQRLPLGLQQCSLYQGQQGDVNQSVRINYKTRFSVGQNLTAVKGNASVF